MGGGGRRAHSASVFFWGGSKLNTGIAYSPPPTHPHKTTTIQQQARFSKPAFPGETLVTSLWKLDGGQRIVFQTTVKERGVVVLEGGLAEIGPAGAGEGGGRSRL